MTVRPRLAPHRVPTLLRPRPRTSVSYRGCPSRKSCRWSCCLSRHRSLTSCADFACRLERASVQLEAYLGQCFGNFPASRQSPRRTLDRCDQTPGPLRHNSHNDSSSGVLSVRWSGKSASSALRKSLMKA